jgi:hypothetical protein
MTPVATYFQERHDIIDSYVSERVDRGRIAEVHNKIDQVEKKIFDALSKAGKPEFVGYNRGGTTVVVQIDYHFKSILFVDYLDSDRVDLRASFNTVIEFPEWHVLTN